MAKILFVCLNENNITEEHIGKVERICNSLNPDNIQPNKSKIAFAGNKITGISNPVRSITVKGVNVLFGQAFGSKGKWDILNGFAPDGNYAIFRSNENKVEIVSDILGTRTVWYYQDDKVFIASTSQRAIVRYLGGFKFNKEVIPWMLTNGLLGPDLSWDTRISMLSADSSLLLDCDSWSYKIKTGEIKFSPNKKSDTENINTLHQTLKTTFSELKLDYSQWNLSLSGGYDSRGNLLFLPKKDKKGKVLETITWGLKKSEEVKKGDARVAREIATKFKLPHQYFYTDSFNEMPEVIFNRFLKNGEGRIDHIGGYMDGFKIWKKLFEKDITGVIRGDEVFGSYDFISDFHLRKFVGLAVHSDYPNLKKIPYINSLDQNFPGKYKKMENETFESWRDRLYQSYLVPFFLSALSDLKHPFIEQINPLLSRKAIMQIREMPDHLRTDKKAFKSIVDSLNPNIGFANSSSTISITNLFEHGEMTDMMRNELGSPIAKKIFPDAFLSFILSELKIYQNSVPWSKIISAYLKSFVPKKIKKGMAKQVYKTPKFDMNLLVFRTFIIVRMHKVFQEDAKLGLKEHKQVEEISR